MGLRGVKLTIPARLFISAMADSKEPAQWSVRRRDREKE